jgi:hypothetical protein
MALSKLQNLTRVDLGRTAVTDVGLQELTGLKNVATLLLDHTKITDAGLTAC